MSNRVQATIVLFLFSLSYSQAKQVYCHTLSVLLRMGERKGCYQGHAGVGLDNEFYDWGPSDDSRSDFLYYVLGDKGEPYTDLRMRSDYSRKGLATIQDIRKYLSSAFNPCAAYEVRVRITSEQAELLKYYWDYIYETRPYFHILKNQCANIAFSSLKYAGLLNHGRVILLPKTLLKRTRAELVSTCGENKGKPAEIYTLKN